MLKARFFDGISSVPKDVTIVFKGDSLSFEYIDLFEHSYHLTWKPADVIHEKHTHGAHRKIRHNTNPLIFLELYDQDFSELDTWLKEQSVQNRRYALFLSRGLLVGLLVTILAIFPLIYFVGLPLIADYAAENMPLEYEQKIGNEMSKSMLNSMEEIQSKSAYADSFATCYADKFEIPIKIHVVKSEQLNAFALPGGIIFVNSAMLNACKTKEEFAALLGHEIGHVQLRHTTKSIMRSVVGSIVFSIVASDFSSVAAIAAEQANRIKDLSYSRDVERSADEFSAKLMNRTRLDLNGMVNLFEVFEEEEKDHGYAIPEFLSTHPLTKERVQTAKDNAKKYANTSLPNKNMDLWFSKLKGE